MCIRDSTNAPGLRHEKRYQDVKELLQAGISVYTTLNIQHLESLNDPVSYTHLDVYKRQDDILMEHMIVVKVLMKREGCLWKNV